MPRLGTALLMILALLAPPAVSLAQNTVPTRSPRPTAIALHWVSATALDESLPRRAVLGGAGEVCVDSTSGKARSAVAPKDCSPLDGAPEICLDATLESAMAPRVSCETDDIRPRIVDLTDSSCGVDTRCLLAEAKTARAAELVVITARWDQQLHLSLSAEVTTVATGSTQELHPEQFSSAYNQLFDRTGPDCLGLLRWFTRAIVNSAARPLELAVGEGKGPVESPASRAPGEAGSAHEPSSSGSFRGWALIGGGAAAAGASTFFWLENGKTTACDAAAGDVDPCRRVWHTLAPALALDGVAAAAIAAGIFFVVHDSNRSVALSVHPSGFTVGGTF